VQVRFEDEADLEIAKPDAGTKTNEQDSASSSSTPWTLLFGTGETPRLDALSVPRDLHGATDELRILAIAHDRRNPGYWKRRR
jgi:hypothetical protein